MTNLERMKEMARAECKRMGGVPGGKPRSESDYQRKRAAMDRCAKVQAYLMFGGKKAPRDIADATGIPTSSINAVITAMEHRGQVIVERNHKGRMKCSLPTSCTSHQPAPQSQPF
ncbi:hypothetical protein AB3Y40_06710 [Yoonia sp. R2331]|uniref:hypothetical protein n=1 Tax=Yoonia sp. R2331 TaxID=3237238 RepID=UPI0034E418F1